MNNKGSEMKRILSILRSKEILVSLIILVSVLLGTIYSYYFKTPKYNASSTLLLIPNNESQMVTSSELNLNSELISTYSNIAKQSKILNKVIKNLDLDMTEEKLLSNLRISNITGTYMIKIVAESTKPQEAMNIANELSSVFLSEIKEIYNLENIGIVDEAEIPTNPYNINHMKDITLSLIIGIVASLIVITFRYLFDDTVKHEEDIENYVEIKTLGKVPLNLEKNEELIDRTNIKSYVLECINTIRTNILYMTAIKTAKTILITSSREEEGKSFISSNIAVAFADIDKKVLLIDADMRKGRADRIFDVNNLYGLSDYLCAMTGNLKEDLELGKKYVIESEIPNLHILTHGIIPPNPAELLTSSKMRELIEMLKKVYDIIIIDAPPCMPVSDSIILSTIADVAILTVNYGKTKIKELIEVKKSIDIVGGNVIGAILNKVKISEKTYSKGYYYYGNGEKVKNETKQKKIVTVNKMFGEAINNLEQSDSSIFEKEEKVKENKVIEENIISDILTKAQLQEIIQKEISKIDFSEEFNKIKELQNINQEEIQKLNNIQNDKFRIINDMISDFKERLENTVNILYQKVGDNEKVINQMLENQIIGKEEIKSLIKEQTLNEKQIQKIVESEMSKLDYNRQLNKLNEIFESLENNYKEIAEKINEQEIQKEEVLKNEKVIDINLLKKAKQKKKKTYSIKEDISYFDLEQTAFCIIPFEKRKENIAL